MSETFKSQALAANLEQTRYKDIFIPAEHQRFIDLSAKYFGINKRSISQKVRNVDWSRFPES